MYLLKLELVSGVHLVTCVNILVAQTRAINIRKCLLPVHFQPGFDAFENQRPYATHQGQKFLSNYSNILSNTGAVC